MMLTEREAKCKRWKVKILNVILLAEHLDPVMLEVHLLLAFAANIFPFFSWNKFELDLWP